MTVDVLETYQFHEKEWESYEELLESFEWEIPDQFNIADYVCDQWAEKRKNSVALYLLDDEGGETAYTFKQLQNFSNRLANYLEGRGVDKGDRIAIHGTQRAEVVIGHLAAFKLGAISVPLSVLLGPDALQYRLDHSDPRAFIIDDEAMDDFNTVNEKLGSEQIALTMDRSDGEADDNFWEALAGESRQFENEATSPEDDACIVYTSGTTGRPKGAVHAHQHLLGLLPGLIRNQQFGKSEGHVTRTVAEWSWIATLNGAILPSWYYGRPIVGYASEGFDPEMEFEIIEKFGVTRLSLAPTAVRMMMQVDNPAERYDLSSLECLSLGGEAVGNSIVEWGAEVFENASISETYGGTEIGAPIGDVPEMGYEHRPGYMGVRAPGHEVAILDPETHEPIEEKGTVGELAIRYEDDPMLFRRYWNEPERTAEKIQNGWVLCEDLASMTDDGYVQYHGRKDDVIISSGYRIDPSEVEESLMSHEAVVNAGVVGVEDDMRGQMVKAFVVLADEYAENENIEEKLQAHVRGNLAKYEYPREIEFIAELPTTTTGKVNRQALQEAN